MGKRGQDGDGRRRRDRRVRVRGIRREPTDVKKLAKALVELSAAQAEAEAQAEHERSKRKSGDAA